MKGALFIVILCVALIVLLLESKKDHVKAYEPFKNKDPQLNVPKVRPDPATLYAGSPQPFAPPTTALLAPPPGQTASVNSYVYEDPAMKKASAQRIQETLVSVKGFLANEAPGLQTLGDPSVTLPLGTARADAQRLEDEVNVLARNPGLQSSLTDGDLNMIQSNLGFLQRKWRLSPNSMKGVEGFRGSASAAGAEGFQGSPGSAAASGPMGSLDYLKQWFGRSDRNYFQDGLSAAAGAAATAGTSVSTTTPVARATLQDLKNLIVQITNKTQQITNSGTQDDILLNRVEALKDVKKRVQTLIDKIETAKTMKESEIPITKSQFTAFMAALAAGTELPSLTTDEATTETDTTPNLKDVFSALGPDGLKNISFDWDIKLRYTGDTEKTLAEEAIKAAAKQALPGAANTNVSSYGPGDETVEPGGYRGAFDSIIKFLTGKGNSDIVKSVSAGDGSGTSSGSGTLPKSGAPATLDWKQKSADICDQIKKREMDPYEFGCMKDTTVVSENFSYRGYAKMICSRLATHYDPSVPELCGCPPVSWPGWRP
jgi:hypothetical protein